MNETATPPDALMVLGSRCPHCPTVLQGLGELIKQGRIGRLEVINLEQRPDLAEALGIRAVPWVRLGPFELEGLRSPAELKQWAERAGSPEGLAEYFEELLREGRLQQVVDHIRRDPPALKGLLIPLADPEAELQIRLGIGAVMEDLAGSEALQAGVADLGELTRHEQALVRNDACHYLGMSASPEAVPYLRARLEDSDPGVVEVAQEALELLSDAGITLH